MAPLLAQLGLPVAKFAINAIFGGKRKKGKTQEQSDLDGIVSLLPKKWQPWASAGFAVMAEVEKISRDGKITAEELDELVGVFLAESGLKDMVVYDNN